MKIYMCFFKKILLALSIIHFSFLIIHNSTYSQSDSTITENKISDTSAAKLNMDAVYNRPFLIEEKFPIAIGGYIEVNTHYSATDGVTDGFSFQFRRMTLFFSSPIAWKIKFLSEIEFEDGTKEINIEFAAMDIELHPMLNLRGGIIMNPIGAFNQNHDGPRWDFIERPISATTIIPSTLSNVGMGLYGKASLTDWLFGYEAYLTNSFDDRIISNEENRTSLAAGKVRHERFEESNSGLPMFTGKIAIRSRLLGELGISYLTGVYNKWESEGFVVDIKRSACIIAIDINTTLFDDRLYINGEFANVIVDVPETYSQNYGTRQYGTYLDLVATIIRNKIFVWENSKINLALRFEYVDYNAGTFKETGGDIADDIVAIVPGIAFRPSGQTVIRFNYRYQQQRDLLGNPPSKIGAIQFGFSTYF